MYCVKCKKATDTSNVQFAVSKNGRNMKRATCLICGTTKMQFIKVPKGRSLLSKAINNLPFKMHLPGHNFTGPGTKLKKRLNPDLTPKNWSKPVNRVDESSIIMRVLGHSCIWLTFALMKWLTFWSYEH